jgi:hypothetical protein
MAKEIGTTEHLVEAVRHFIMGVTGDDTKRTSIICSKYRELNDSFEAYEKKNKKSKKPKSELDQLVEQWNRVRPLDLEYTVDGACPYCGHKEDDVGDDLSNA